MTRWFLDSGAFSAARHGKPIVLDDYIRYIKRHRRHLEVYANLDVIPTAASGSEAAAKASWQNFKAMRAAGLEPMPVFHLGESIKWLDRMVGADCSYIGLGGVARRHTRAQRDSFKSCFKHIPSTVRVHGFGVTNAALLHEFPWATSDSVAWRLLAANGCFYLPMANGAGFRYADPPLDTAISEREVGGRVVYRDDVHAGSRAAFQFFGPAVKRLATKYITEELGLTPRQLMQSKGAREIAAIRYHLKVQSSVQRLRPNYYLYFGCDASRATADLLMAEKVTGILVSFAAVSNVNLGKRIKECCANG